MSSIHRRSVTSASSAAYSVALSSGSLTERPLGLLLARHVRDYLLERHAGMPEVAHGEIVHAVPALAGVERVGHQHGVVERRHVDAVLREDVEIVLDVLADLEDRRIFEQRLQQRQGFDDGNLHDAVVRAEVEGLRAGAVAKRHVTGFARCHGHGEADQLGDHGIDRRRLGVEG